MKPETLLHSQRKEIALKAIAEVGTILEALYNLDKPRYQPLYGWLHKMAKWKSPVLLLQTMKRLQERDESKQPAADVVQYCGGTLRRLEEQREAKRLRAGRGPSLLGDIIDRAKRANKS